MAIRIKRSMSPDGKIDSVTVELEIEAEITDTQAVLDAIAITDAYAASVAAKQPQRTTSNGGQATSSGGPQGAVEYVRGHVQAVYEGEPSRNTGKMGPGAIVIEGIKVKSFDRETVSRAQQAKANGREVNCGFVRNSKWNSNDVKSLEVL